MAKYPAIPSPNLAPESLRDAVLALKQDVEMLTGQLGDPLTRAITRGDLADLGLITRDAALYKPSPYRAPQQVQGWTVEGIALYDDAGVARIPAIKVTWAGGVAGVQGLRAKVQLVSDHSPVTSSYFNQSGTNELTITQSILPETEYEVSVQYVSDAAGEQQWSDWATVTTPSATFGTNTIDVGVREQVTTILDQRYYDLNRQIAELASAVQQALGRSFIDKKEVRSQQVSLYGSNKALIETVQTTAAAADAAMAVRIDTVEADVADNTASIQTTQSALSTLDTSVADLETNVVAQIGDNGVGGALRATVSTNASAITTLNGYAAAQYAVKLDVNGYATGYQIINGGSPASSGFIVTAPTFQVAFPGTGGGGAVPVFGISTVGGTAKLALRGDMIADGAIVARNMVSTNVSALFGSFGTMTAGIIQSTDGKTYWNLDAGYMLGSD
jgi:hypothetical protein